MGMAASQARYLSLVARQVNIEYEGQQINQARTALANQSANLFNQMLGLQVPVPPSTQDFTISQYSFTDGINPAVIDKWEQLATPDDDGYNYVVEYHYDANVYKGFQKQLNDPQIQFTYATPTDTSKSTEKSDVTAIYAAQKKVADAQDDYDEKKAIYEAEKAKASKLVTYRDTSTYNDKVENASYLNKMYSIEKTDGSTANFYAYDTLGQYTGATVNGWYNESSGMVYSAQNDSGSLKPITSETKLYTYAGTLCTKDKIGSSTTTPLSNDAKIYVNSSGTLTITETGNNKYTNCTDEQKNALDKALEIWDAEGVNYDTSRLYYNPESGEIAFQDDLENLKGVDGLMKTLYIYDANSAHTTSSSTNETIYSEQKKLADAKTDAENAYASLQVAETELEQLNIPEYLGNTKLTSIYPLTKEQFAEIKQIMTDMTKNGATTNFDRCFSSAMSPSADNYIGGIYTFERDGVTYYTTYYDLADTAADTEFMNPIDNQAKLNYYHANYVTESVDKTQKAVLDTDAKGRFKTVRFEDGSQYTLNFEEKTDDEAYQDAMNQYYYQSAAYDKMVQDLNSKTSVIQQEDRTLELKLKQMETEHSALKSEIEAVQKVVKDDVDKSFKTFGS